MAQRVITQLVSDLSGDEVENGNGETITFAYRGVEYSIDLTTQEAEGFDNAIATYVDHATKTGGRRGRKSSGSSSTGSDAKAIRAWANEQGLDVPERGRIPAELREQYEAAN